MNELVSREDINKVAEMNNSALNVVVAQMTTLANAVVSGRDDIDCMVESLEKQPWYKRMWNTLTGKNKATKEEIAQKKDQMTGYLIQSVSGLYEMGKINQDIMVSLGQKINDIYYQVSLNSFEQLATKQSIIQLKDMVGKIAIALNEKIESVDNFNILNEQIKQGVYSNEKVVSAMCRIISNMDNRMLSDQRKVDIICRSMETAGIINDEEIAISDIMADIAAIAEDKTGEVYLELSSMNGNFWAGLFSELMEKYNLLPKMERMAKKKDVIIRNILDKNDIDESAAFSVRDLYGSFIESRQEMAEMTGKVRIEDNSDGNVSEAPVIKDNASAEYHNGGSAAFSVRDLYGLTIESGQKMSIDEKVKDIFKCVFQEGKEYKADEFCTLLTETYPEAGRELADIIAEKCLMKSRTGDFFFIYDLAKVVYDYHDDNYYKMSTDDLYDKLVDNCEALCGDFLEMGMDPIGSPIKVRADDYEYECNDHYSTFKRSVIGNGQSLRNVEIEYFTTRIGKYAFFGHNEIRNIVIPNSIEEICDYAFREACTDAVIVIPDSVHTISRTAFDWCYSKKIYICDWAKVKEITFNYCSFERVVLSQRLETVEISQCNSLVTLDLKNIFPYDAEVELCNCLETVIFHNDQSDNDFFSTYRFFSNCPKLKNLYFPKDFRRNLVNDIIETICNNNEGMTPSDLNIVYF